MRSSPKKAKTKKNIMQNQVRQDLESSDGLRWQFVDAWETVNTDNGPEKRLKFKVKVNVKGKRNEKLGEHFCVVKNKKWQIKSKS
jgi:hypothetical protein